MPLLPGADRPSASEATAAIDLPSRMTASAAAAAAPCYTWREQTAADPYLSGGSISDDGATCNNNRTREAQFTINIQAATAKNKGHLQFVGVNAKLSSQAANPAVPTGYKRP